MKKSFLLKNQDFIELTRAYIGVFVFLWWGIWSEVNHHQPFNDLNGFITSFGGLL